MKIVPLTVSVFDVAFQEISPPVLESSQYTDAPEACVVAVVPATPRTTVHVVVPWPPVTIMSSSSTRTRKAPFVGKPVADGTEIVVCVAVIEPPKSS